MWIAQSVQQVWKYAVSQGGGEKDGTALITYLEPWAGVEVRARGDAAPPRRVDAIASRRIDGARHRVRREDPRCLARRLREQNWNVAVAGEDAAEAARIVPLSRDQPTQTRQAC